MLVSHRDEDKAPSQAARRCKVARGGPLRAPRGARVQPRLCIRKGMKGTKRTCSCRCTGAPTAAGTRVTFWGLMRTGCAAPTSPTRPTRRKPRPHAKSLCIRVASHSQRDRSIYTIIITVSILSIFVKFPNRFSGHCDERGPRSARLLRSFRPERWSWLTPRRPRARTQRRPLNTRRRATAHTSTSSSSGSTCGS